MTTPTSTRLLTELVAWTQKTSNQIGQLEAGQNDLRGDVAEIKAKLRTKKMQPNKVAIALAGAITAVATGLAAWLAT